MKIGMRREGLRLGSGQALQLSSGHAMGKSKQQKIFGLVFLCAFMFALQPFATAQPSGKIPRIGYFSFYSDERDKLMAAFRQGLRELGYEEGKNIIIEQRDGKDNRKLTAQLIDELIKLKVDLIATGAQGARAAKTLKSTIPIVLLYSADPVNEGLVTSLARPGSNITGLSDYHGDLVSKRLEILKEITPSGKRIAIIYHARNPANGPMVKDAERAAPALGLTVVPIAVTSSGDIDRAFAKMKQDRVSGLLQFVGLGGFRKQIIDLGTRYRIPTIYTRGQWISEGGLMSYGSHWPDLVRRAGTFVDKILKGAKPADLPVEQPKKFEMVINLKTANAMGLTIPPSVLFRANEVIR